MRENIIRKTTSESGFPQKALEKDLSPDFFDQLADAEQFKTKGDAFYQNSKYEQAFKVYEIARDLINDYCADNEEKVKADGADYLRVNQLRLTIVMALVESAFQLGWYEEAIVFCREGIETNGGIARLHHMLAKSILGLSDSLNNKDRGRGFSPDYMKGNLEHALHSLMRAKELQPGNVDIINDLDYVTGIYGMHNSKSGAANENSQPTMTPPVPESEADRS